MNYQLANGKTIRMTEEQFFKMTEQDLKDLEGSNYGYVVNDPFFDSAMFTEMHDVADDIIEPDSVEIDEDFLDKDE